MQDPHIAENDDFRLALNMLAKYFKLHNFQLAAGLSRNKSHLGEIENGKRITWEELADNIAILTLRCDVPPIAPEVLKKIETLFEQNHLALTDRSR